MKILSKISFIIILTGLIILTQITTITLSIDCIEYESPIYKFKTKTVKCPIVVEENKRQEPPPPADNMFTVDFQCAISDTELCRKVQNVFITAGKFITATLDLKSTISVSAKFLNFCETFGDCDKEALILGAAGPARLIPYQDPVDNRIRLYPQALYKQLGLVNHPAFGKNEIKAIFNSDAKYWFEGDPLPMVPKSADMLYVVIHELIHGLGFANSWNDYFGINALTPAIAGIVQVPDTPGPPDTPGAQPGAQPGAKGLFIETIFDKYLVLTKSGKSLTFLTDELNKFPIDLNLPASAVKSAFVASPQYQIAKDIYNSAVTQGEIGFLISPTPPAKVVQINDDVILETSLNPYQRSSSIAHVDLQTYLHSSDFLMMFTYPPGQTLGQMMYRANSTDTTGPIGPKLRLILEILGYTVKKTYVPPVTLSNIKTNDNLPGGNDTVPVTMDRPNDSSIISFNLGLSLICILFTLTYNHYFQAL